MADFFDELLNRFSERRGQIGFWLHKGWSKPWLQPNEVGGDQNLPITAAPAPNSNSRDVQFHCDVGGYIRLNKLEDQRTAAGILEFECTLDQ